MVGGPSARGKSKVLFAHLLLGISKVPSTGGWCCIVAVDSNGIYNLVEDSYVELLFHE